MTLWIACKISYPQGGMSLTCNSEQPPWRNALICGGHHPYVDPIVTCVCLATTGTQWAGAPPAAVTCRQNGGEPQRATCPCASCLEAPTRVATLRGRSARTGPCSEQSMNLVHVSVAFALVVVTTALSNRPHKQTCVAVRTMRLGVSVCVSLLFGLCITIKRPVYRKPSECRHCSFALYTCHQKTIFRYTKQPYARRPPRALRGRESLAERIDTI